jgi:electron transfer flavoprotein beta subunit
MPNIVVCMKVIYDPEVPASLFEIDTNNKKPVPPTGMSPVFSPFDENALEAAIKIKDELGWTVTIVSMGKSIPKALVQKGMALGADDVVTIEGKEFEDLDPFTAAHTLSGVIEKIGSYDLIFTGRQSADWDAGIVWAGVTEILNIPCVTIARNAQVKDGKVIVERCVSDGIEFVETSLPALITFSSEVGELRYVSLPALMKAKKRTYTKWSAGDVVIKKSDVVSLVDLYKPDFGKFECQLINGESAAEKGKKLAKKLIRDGVLQQ